MQKPGEIHLPYGVFPALILSCYRQLPSPFFRIFIIPYPTMKPEFFILLIVLVLAYVCLNLLVTQKINQADYFKEDRRTLHKRFIWLLPFLGPLAIRGFWKKKKDTGLEVMTREKRGKSTKANFSDNWESTTGMGGGV